MMQTTFEPPRRLQIFLYQRVRAAEPWVDFALPVATALIFAEQITSANIVLFIWMCSRLVLFSSLPTIQNWILGGLALVNCSTIILDRGGKPSDPSDLLVIFLAFAAGLNRNPQQWKQSAAIIATCLIPVAVSALNNNSEELLRFPEVNVNRLSFFLGLAAIASYASFRWSRRRATKIFMAALTILTLPLGLLTDSRAAIVAPAISIAAAWAANKLHALLATREARKKHALLSIATILTMAATSLTCSYIWYRDPKASSENITNDTKRLETSKCWMVAPYKFGEPFFGLGYNEKVRSHCDGRSIPYMKMMDHDDGLPHAHNVPAQLMGETGIPGLLFLAIAIGLAGQRLRRQLKSINKSITTMGTLTLPLCIYLALTGLTTSFYIYLMLNQVLIGYLLGALTATQTDSESNHALSQRLLRWPLQPGPLTKDVPT